MDFSKINQELFKLDAGKYQKISINEQTEEIQISEPFLGRIFYLQGYRTNTDDLSNYLMNKISENQANLEEKQFSYEKRQKRNEIFKTIQLTINLVNSFFSITSDQLPQIQETFSKYSERIKQLKEMETKLEMEAEKEEAEGLDVIHVNMSGSDTKIYVSMSKARSDIKMDPAILDICAKECRAYSEAKNAYELIESQTRNLHFSASQQVFSLYNPETHGEEVMEVHPLHPTQKFFVHATTVDNAIPLITVFKEKQFPHSTICMSLIDSEHKFFSAMARDIAIVVAVDPNAITLTSSYDIHSPVQPREAYRFYTIQQKLLLLTSRINEIHQRSGLSNKTNEMRLIMNQLDIISEEINNIHIIQRENKQKISQYFNGDMSFDEFIELSKTNAFSEEQSRLLDSVVSIRARMQILREKESVLEQEFKKIKKKYSERNYSEIGPSERGKFSLLENESYYQIIQLIDHYNHHPKENHSPEEFLKIFNYHGVGIVDELNKYKRILLGLKENYPSIRFKRFMHPEELLSMTRPNEHNEFNIKLDTQGIRPMDVKGIVVTRKYLDHIIECSNHSRNALVGTEKETSVAETVLKRHLKLLTYAKQESIPIFIKEIAPKAKL